MGLFVSFNMRRFRDFEKEAAAAARTLGLTGAEIVVDLGAGTGAFAVPGAKYCRRVIAVDTSCAMLDFAAHKAEAAGIGTIEFVLAGFLTYRHPGEKADAVVSKMALHHLPDFWKAVALERIHSFLKPGGRFLLTDVVFSFPAAEYEKHFRAEADGLCAASSEEFAAEASVHFREEYSTFDWILEGMLERAGFRTADKKCLSPIRIEYLCRA